MTGQPVPPPFCSVIVPAYQAAGTIGLCLAALAAQTVPPDRYEVIVVDDGSTDGTAALARRAGAHVIDQPHAGAASCCSSPTPTARPCRAGSRRWSRRSRTSRSPGRRAPT